MGAGAFLFALLVTCGPPPAAHGSRVVQLNQRLEDPANAKRCSNAVPGAVYRSSGWRRHQYCRCPRDSEMRGAGCQGPFFHPEELGGKDCSCQKKPFITIADSLPNFECKSEFFFKADRPDLPDIAASAKTWCDSSRVPEAKRVPPNLRGLYWMKDASLSWGDVAFCTSLAEWDPKTRTALLAPWTHFVWRRYPEEDVPHDLPVLASSPLMWGRPFYYQIVFEDDSLTKGRIYSSSWLINLVVKFPMTNIQETKDGLVKSKKVGDVYERPNAFGLFFDFLKFEVPSMLYYAVRIAEDDGTVHQDRYDLMRSVDRGYNVTSTFVRYATSC